MLYCSYASPQLNKAKKEREIEIRFKVRARVLDLPVACTGTSVDHCLFLTLDEIIASGYCHANEHKSVNVFSGPVQTKQKRNNRETGYVNCIISARRLTSMLLADSVVLPLPDTGRK